MLALYFCLLTALLATEYSKDNLIDTSPGNKPKARSRSKRALDILPAKDSAIFSRLDDSRESVPLQKTMSDTLPRRFKKTSDGALPRRRRQRPLSYEHELTDPTDPLMYLIEPRPRKISSGCSPTRPENKVTYEQAFSGLTDDQLRWIMAERRLNYLQTKSDYAKAKLEYHQIKHFLAKRDD